MCITCGCSTTDHDHKHDHKHDHHHDHGSDHGHTHNHEGRHSHHHGTESVKRTTIAIEEDILGKNNRLAVFNRALFREKGIFVLNLVSSPGSGKTTLLERTLRDLSQKLRFAVIEGDQQTDNDARRCSNSLVSLS